MQIYFQKQQKTSDNYVRGNSFKIKSQQDLKVLAFMKSVRIVLLEVITKITTEQVV